MRISELYAFLDSHAPFESAENWDNSGLLLGDLSYEVSRVYLSLDVSLDILDSLESNSLLIVHHPFIFTSMRKVDFSTTIGKIIQACILKNISIICMHTNYDKSILNSYFTKQVLGFDSYTSDTFVCKVDVDMNFDELVAKVKSKLNLSTIQIVRPDKCIVRSLGITTGSGSEFVFSSSVDVYLTGDLKYHTAFDAKERGVGLIDISHFASEICFADSLAEILKILPIEVIITNSKNPFEYC